MLSLRGLLWFGQILQAIAGNNSAASEVGELHTDDVAIHNSSALLSVRDLNPPPDPAHHNQKVENILSGLQVGVWPLMMGGNAGGKAASQVVGNGIGKAFSVGNFGFGLGFIFGIAQLAFTIHSEHEMEKWQLRMAYVEQAQARIERKRLNEQLDHEQWRIGNETEHNWWKTQDPVQKAMYVWYYECLNATETHARQSKSNSQPFCATAKKSIEEHHPEWSEEMKNKALWKFCDGKEASHNHDDNAKIDACKKLEDVRMQYLRKVPPEFLNNALVDRIAILENQLSTLALAHMVTMTKLEHLAVGVGEVLDYVVRNVQWKEDIPEPNFTNWKGESMDAQFWNQNFTQRIYDIAVPASYNQSLPFSEFLQHNHYHWEESKHSEPPWEMLHRNTTNPFYQPKEWELYPSRFWKIVYCEDYDNAAREECSRKEMFERENVDTPSGRFQKSYKSWFWVCKNCTDPALPPDTEWEPKEIWRYAPFYKGFDKNTVSVVCGRVDPHVGHIVDGAVNLDRPKKHHHARRDKTDDMSDLEELDSPEDRTEELLALPPPSVLPLPDAMKGTELV